MSQWNSSHPNSSYLSGNHPQDTQPWLHRSVQSFFSTCNWENQPIKIQDLNWSALTLSDRISEPLTLRLSVHHFFVAVNWDGSLISEATISEATISEATIPEVTPAIEQPLAASSAKTFTLTDFSDLF